ncbi:VOC family protein [Lysobacter enzymogenes]|uniref:VOC family protein n=1 Tax=Lysobacter enzymogenes TaxID=69 RepID=UPI0037498F15
MHLSSIHHVAIVCADYERSRRFYIDALGLRVDECTGRRFAFCADPDGLPIEFYEG